MRSTMSDLNAQQMDVLVGECKDAIVETSFISHSEDIRGRWCVGDAILRDPQYVKLSGGRGRKSFIQEVGGHLKERLPGSQQRGWSRSEVYRCVQFAAKFPDLDLDALADLLGVGKALTWTAIKRYVLPDKPAEAAPRKPAADRKAIAAISLEAVGTTWTQEAHETVMTLLGLD